MCVNEKVNQTINKIGNTQDKLIEVLIEVQAQSQQNYISEEEVKLIAKGLDVSFSKAYAAASFYSMLSTERRGKYVIQICNSAPCYLNGGKEVTKIIKGIVGIDIGEVTDDGLFSLEFTSCIGACDVAPAIRINNTLYGNLNEEKLTEIINSIRKGEN